MSTDWQEEPERRPSHIARIIEQLRSDRSRAEFFEEEYEDIARSFADSLATALHLHGHIGRIANGDSIPVDSSFEELIAASKSLAFDLAITIRVIEEMGERWNGRADDPRIAVPIGNAMLQLHTSVSAAETEEDVRIFTLPVTDEKLANELLPERVNWWIKEYSTV
jgi:hypothetical protein